MPGRGARQDQGKKLTHIDGQGRARMVDVSQKKNTLREAVAAGTIVLRPETLRLLLDRGMPKGDVLCVAQLAGIMAAKRTADIIPLCHLLAVSSVEVSFAPDAKRSRLHIKATVRCTGGTGVEMEALTAVAVAGLTVYDMCKAVDREMIVTDIRLLKKSGGRSGFFVRDSRRTTR